MICDNCQTELPDEAAACWKCGKQFKSASTAPPHKEDTDVFLGLVTFIFSAGFFVCGGWGVPFTVWGKTMEASRNLPGWSDVLGLLGGVLFVVSAIAVFGGLWMGSYWVAKRVTAVPSHR